jgi:hypothetical protein
MSTSRAINEYNGIQSLYHHKSEDNKTAIQNAAISNFISSDIGDDSCLVLIEPSETQYPQNSIPYFHG